MTGKMLKNGIERTYNEKKNTLDSIEYDKHTSLNQQHSYALFARGSPGDVMQPMKAFLQVAAVRPFGIQIVILIIRAQFLQFFLAPISVQHQLLPLLLRHDGLAPWGALSSLG
ncbi:hypothetical protein HUJ05_007366 [Dendroctonus ponderosae]|nr:hypothetical protein HUJ05_007366 [Dendroctonus ponderosae]